SRSSSCRATVGAETLAGQTNRGLPHQQPSRYVSEPSESHNRNGAIMTSSNQEDLEERIFARLDPGGELGDMLSAFRSLTGNAFGRGLLRLLGGRDIDL